MTAYYGLIRLTPSRIALLRRLDDGPEEDCVGLELDELRAHEFHAADYLVDRGLVEFAGGWDFTLWYRLTERGRKVLRALGR